MGRRGKNALTIAKRRGHFCDGIHPPAMRVGVAFLRVMAAIQSFEWSSSAQYA
jgi:hypothetical protein